MTEQLPPPLTPPEADLSDFAFMPLQVARLRTSKAWLICKRRPDVAFYMLNLWTSAWHERPAGSLEDDDDVLADRAMCSPDRWPDVKADALRGWVKCSDGRIYHPVVAEKVNEAWRSKREYAYGKECERLAKALRRAGVKKITDEMLPDYASWDRAETSGGQFSVSEGKVVLSPGHPTDTRIYKKDVPRTHPVCPPENALKGQGEGQGKGEGEGYISRDGACPADIPGLSGGQQVTRKVDIQKPPKTPPGGGDWEYVGELKVELTDREHHDRFVSMYAKYPKFEGADLIQVEHECRLLVANGEETWDSLDAHTQRYADFVTDGGVSDLRYVKNPLNFFTTASIRRSAWTLPPTKAEKRLDKNLANAEQAKRELLEEGL